MQEKIDNGEYRSLPARERGLKFPARYRKKSRLPVAPCAGAWIEIVKPVEMVGGDLSLPARERGLKLFPDAIVVGCSGRSLRGSVD